MVELLTSGFSVYNATQLHVYFTEKWDQEQRIFKLLEKSPDQRPQDKIFDPYIYGFFVRI